MKTILVLGSVVASMIMVGCGSSTPTERFTSESVNKQVVLTDSKTGLEWVNGASAEDISDGTAHGCLGTPTSETENTGFQISEAYCENLDFAGYTDWRVPTAAEHQEFVVEMEREGKVPFYANPACPRVAGTNNANHNTVNTHNSAPTGEIKLWNALPFGTRCVR